MESLDIYKILLLIEQKDDSHEYYDNDDEELEDYQSSPSSNGYTPNNAP